MPYTTDAEKDAAYAQAKEYFTHVTVEEDLKKAEAAFRELDGYKSAAQYLQKTETLIEYVPGHHVSYGKQNGGPIRWKVADIRGKMRLLIADDLLTLRAYNAERFNTFWKTSGARAWLNHDFIKDAFTPEERLRIMSTPVKTAPNPGYYTEGGEDSVDKLFLLSLDEAEKYLPEESERARETWWWLRTPGCNLLSTVGVDKDGACYVIGINIDYDKGGIRPAMWVMLKV